MCTWVFRVFTDFFWHLNVLLGAWSWGISSEAVLPSVSGSLIYELKKILQGNNERIKAVMFSQVTNLAYNHPYWHGEEMQIILLCQKRRLLPWGERIHSWERLDSVPTAVLPGVWVESGLVLCCFHETKWRKKRASVSLAFRFHSPALSSLSFARSLMLPLCLNVCVSSLVWRIVTI